MNSFNRTMLLVLGIAMMASGVLGVAGTRDWVSDAEINDAIPFRTAWDHWRGINWSTGNLWILAGAALAATLIALYALIRELIPSSLGRDDNLVLQRTQRGRTTVSIKALRKALEHEAELVDGVSDARIDQLAVDGDEAPHVTYRVRTPVNRSLPETGKQVITQASRSLSTTLDRPDTQVTAIMEARARAADRNERVE